MPERSDPANRIDDEARPRVADDREDDAPDVPELTRFEQAFLDHPVARDVALFAFLAGFYGGGMSLVLPSSLPVTWPVGMGVAFAVGWLALMEVYARRTGSSMVRSLGADPHAPLLDDRE
ncbi:hypothetical protein [Halorubellus litoreus]|uniref:Uncharacterized protein n=1 Tax=Halorubellus litoreus TaxID=755308 RepID=A0ABD5VM23_9EURY